MVKLLAATSMNFGERVAYAGRVLLIGMATVFLSLAVLWAILILFRLITEQCGKKKSTAPASDAVVSAPTAPVADNGELIAAITAAVAMTLAEENGGATPAFRVVSFKKINR